MVRYLGGSILMLKFALNDIQNYELMVGRWKGGKMNKKQEQYNVNANINMVGLCLL